VALRRIIGLLSTSTRKVYVVTPFPVNFAGFCLKWCSQ
jgi:hypothetical protein